MSSSILDDGGSSGLGGMFEKMPSMDLITVLVLGVDAYMLYTQLDYYNRGSLTSVSTDPYILALQATIVLIAIYTVEFLHDRGEDH